MVQSDWRGEVFITLWEVYFLLSSWWTLEFFQAKHFINGNTHVGWSESSSLKGEWSISFSSFISHYEYSKKQLRYLRFGFVSYRFYSMSYSVQAGWGAQLRLLSRNERNPWKWDLLLFAAVECEPSPIWSLGDSLQHTWQRESLQNKP